jgi:hypothetical protein
MSVKLLVDLVTRLLSLLRVQCIPGKLELAVYPFVVGGCSFIVLTWHNLFFHIFRGDKENGVAGHGDTEGHQYTPKLLERLAGKRVVQLSACGFHTACLTAEDELFTW